MLNKIKNLLFFTVLFFSVSVFGATLDKGTYSIQNNTHHDSPVGAGMCRSYTEVESTVEVTNNGIYVQVGFNNTQFMGDFTIKVNGNKVSYEVAKYDQSKDIKELKFKVNSLSDQVTVGLFVVPMNTTVEYQLTFNESTLKLIQKAEEEKPAVEATPSPSAPTPSPSTPSVTPSTTPNSQDQTTPSGSQSQTTQPNTQTESTVKPVETTQPTETEEVKGEETEENVEEDEAPSVEETEEEMESVEEEVAEETNEEINQDELAQQVEKNEETHSVPWVMYIVIGGVIIATAGLIGFKLFKK